MKSKSGDNNQEEFQYEGEPKYEGGAKSCVERITPEMAKAYLDKNQKNWRNGGDFPTHVENLARQMRAGQWRVNGESIKFDADGFVRDGQNRLRAIIKSGVAIDTFVTRGLEEDADGTMDGGRPRSFSDWLRHKGYTSCNAVASTVTYLERSDKGISFSTNSSRPNHHELKECFKRHESGIMASLKKVGGMRFLRGGISPFLHYQFSKKDADLADKFFEALHEGSGLRPDDPVLKLRDMLIKNKESRSHKMNREYQIALTIKAWNMWRNNRTCRVLTYRAVGPNPESFPEIE